MTASAETSRRALLVGAVGGVAALVGQALGRPAPVHAEDEAIVVGGEYTTATSRTMIRNQTNGQIVLMGWSDSETGWATVGYNSSTGVGLRGESAAGWGVYATSNTDSAIYAHSGSGIGVHGVSESYVGVNGFSTSGYGGIFDGGRAQLKLAPKPTAGKPTTGTHEKGEIYMDSKSNMFVCSVAGTPGTWKKVLTKLV